jgi:hypothetical protein
MQTGSTVADARLKPYSMSLAIFYKAKNSDCHPGAYLMLPSAG